MGSSDHRQKDEFQWRSRMARSTNMAGVPTTGCEVAVSATFQASAASKRHPHKKPTTLVSMIGDILAV